ncbi:hypothetical protein HDU76_012819 [Blyttiomyces sp. JEL0837]|nr:hypothetical protein HDU76_012819 [Blyttiomyces sp. JEL0837]
MTFGAVWDQWREVESYCQDGVHMMENINEFLKKRADLEAEYAKGLQKLVKPFREDFMRKASDKKGYVKAIVGSTSFQAWTQMLNEADNAATVHLGISEKLDTELRKTIKHQARDNEAKFKVKFDEIKKASTDLQKQVALMEKLREKYEADKKVMENAKANEVKMSTSTKPGDAETAKVEAIKKALAASDSMEEYQQAMVLANQKKNKLYKVTIPAILNDVQNDDETNRIGVIKSGLGKYFEFLSSQQPNITKGLEAMNAVFETISSQYDSDLLEKSIKTGDSIPPDYMFEEKAVGYFKPKFIKADSSYFTNAATCFQAANDFTMVKRPRSASLVPPQPDEDETIFAMPPKKGRKAAVDRVKNLDRDAADLDKKINAIDSLLAVYAEKTVKDPRYIQRLINQRQILEIKITNIGLKKHKLQTYIANADNQLPPPMPEHLLGKTIQSPSFMEILDDPLDTPADSAASSPSKPGEVASPDSTTSPTMQDGSKPSTTVATVTTGPIPTVILPGVGGPAVNEELTAWGGNPEPPMQTYTGFLYKAFVNFDFTAAPRSDEVTVKTGQEVNVISERDDG